MLALPFAHHEYNLKLIKRLYLARTKDEKFLKQLNPIKIKKYPHLNEKNIPENLSPRIQNTI